MSTFLPSASKFASSCLNFLKRPSKKSAVAVPGSGVSGLSIPQLVAAQAQAHPEASAVIAGDQVFSYGDLELQSNAVAQYLDWLGVGPGNVVALLMERSAALVATALGVMKTGAAYLPLDPSYPHKRVALILEDAQAPLILTSSGVACDIPQGPWKVADVGKIQSTANPYSARKNSISASELAYVIYTSGSTGRPKGVEITHRNLQNLVQWHLRAFSVSSSDRATLLASPGFDAAVWEIWPYLAVGASLHVVDDVTRASPRALRNWMLSKGVTIGFVPTAVAHRLIFLDWPVQVPLRYLLTGADVLQQYPPADLPFTLVNNYGPTECTVVATSGVVLPRNPPCARPPIGWPITNTQAYVLDEKLQQVPVGSVGELYIAGANVGRGYRNDPKLTAEKFIANPFSKERSSRLYKTGDLVRLLPTGELEFIGRTDNQIKIRGHRIEPDEVSTALCKHSAVQSSMVVALKNASGELFLVGYVVWNRGHCTNASALRDHLRAHVPDHMVPNAFVALSSFSLTTNCKVDRSALPAPNAFNTLRDHVSSPPCTETEQKLMAILCALLKVERVDGNDNFFLLGGHSLLGAQLLAQIHNVFHLELSLRTLFDHPTVCAISAEIDRSLAAQREIPQTDLNDGNQPNIQSSPA